MSKINQFAVKIESENCLDAVDAMLDVAKTIAKEKDKHVAEVLLVMLMESVHPMNLGHGQNGGDFVLTIKEPRAMNVCLVFGAMTLHADRVGYTIHGKVDSHIREDKSGKRC